MATRTASSPTSRWKSASTPRSRPTRAAWASSPATRLRAAADMGLPYAGVTPSTATATSPSVSSRAARSKSPPPGIPDTVLEEMP